MIISDIVYLNIVIPKTSEPVAYEPELRAKVSNYDQYDSIVLLWYQPWEGSTGAQGYAMLKGVCDPAMKIMYIVPNQNAAFYLAHEFGHQVGLHHQSEGPCFTNSYMSVMTEAHTASFEQARWTTCENDWINSNICQFSCLFNKPAGYQPILNKFSTMPGKRMNNDQQAKMIEPNADNRGESPALSYMPSEAETRCLYFQYYTGAPNGAFKYIFSPMLPGSTCGTGSICYLDRCVSEDKLSPNLLKSELETDTLDLTGHCAKGGPVSALKESNTDTRSAPECIDWETELLCRPAESCPAADDRGVKALYVNHVCCAKCSSKPKQVAALFAPTASASSASISLCFSLISWTFVGKMAFE